VGDPSSIPGLRRATGGGNGYPLQYFFSGEFHGQRSLGAYSAWGSKNSDMNE